MSVFAGFGGQKFIYDSLDRIHTLKSRLQEKNDSALIEVDGGVNVGNAAALAEAGADILVAGNAVFKAENPQEVISQLRNPR
jgi:ribulose-phosphate 3-epimerase